jgi:dTDP-4-amino-4,6-dideoxygalactose transaminase
MTMRQAQEIHGTSVAPIPLVDVALQFSSIENDVRQAIDRVLTTCDFILGAEVARFEEAFARFIGVEHAIGVASGLDALSLSLMALNVGPGHEVILPANTFIATALAVSAVGAKPILVDCDPATFNIDVSQIEQAITPRTRAILPVHLTGQPADMSPILTMAERHGLAVIEDACQAHGATYHGKSCGSLGRAAAFSFYPGKNLGGCGDGGLISTNDGQVARRLRQLRHYGQEAKYHHLEKGLNSRLDTIQAAVLRAKLEYLPRWNAARVGHAQEYVRRLAGVGDLVLQQAVPDSTHVYHLFIIQTADRDGLQGHLAARGIQTGIHYPTPIHLQPAYKDLGYRPGAFPATERLAGRMLSLPMFPELQHDQIFRIASAIRDWFAR